MAFRHFAPRSRATRPSPRLVTPLTLLFLAPLFALVTVAASCVPARSIDTSSPLTARVQAGIEKGAATFSHAQLDALLEAHVRTTGRVDYAALKRDHDKLKAYLAELAAADIASLSRDELLAFFINAYNAYTLDLIVRNYPLKSIKDTGKPWDTPFCEIGGDKITLNAIEHQFLRPKELFDDPRMHFAINCASIGCPLLRPEAYAGARVAAQLDDSVRRCLTDTRYLTLADGEVRATKVLSWFKDDFVAKHGSLAAFLIPYAPDPIKKALEAGGDGVIGFLDYSWDLNDVRE